MAAAESATAGRGLELIDLHKSYGETVALDGLSFAVEPGQMFGFVGPNGSGKTTAMRIVLGVLLADSGDVRWRGEPIDAERRRRIGYMPEERGLYPKMRVGRQLAYLATLHGLDDRAAEEAAHHWAERLGVLERLGDTVEELSLGNQQRVQLAAALVHGPDLLVLDEPFSGLDPVGVDVLSEVLVEEVRSHGLPVVFSSHQLDLVERLCDAVAVVDAGRLVANGTVEELRTGHEGELWRVDVAGAGPGPGPDWAEGLAGVSREGEAIFRLQPGTDPAVLLDAARAAGSVTYFGAQRPTLAELFRDTVDARS